MKKILIILGLIVAVYIVTAVTLTVTGTCPQYIDMMPKIIRLEFGETSNPHDPQLWHVFCPFAERVY